MARKFFKRKASPIKAKKTQTIKKVIKKPIKHSVKKRVVTKTKKLNDKQKINPEIEV